MKWDDIQHYSGIPNSCLLIEWNKQTERSSLVWRSLVVPTSQGSNPGICTQNNPPRCARWLGLLRRWPRLRCAAPACVLRWSPAQVQFVPCGHGTGFRGVSRPGSYGPFLMQCRGGGSSLTGRVSYISLFQQAQSEIKIWKSCPCITVFGELSNCMTQAPPWPNYH